MPTKHCIHEPDDACVDCSPNCPNSETFGQEESGGTPLAEPICWPVIGQKGTT